MPEMIHLHDDSPDNAFEPPDGFAKGLVSRDYSAKPVGHYATIPAFSGKLYTDEEIQAAIKRKDAEKSWLSDLRDVGGPNGKPIPSRDQNGRGYCTLPSSRVLMADGSRKPIAEVALMDKVVTAKGNVGTVKQLHQRDYDGEMVEFWTNGRKRLSLTPNHEVLVAGRGYVPAGMLSAIHHSLPRDDAVMHRTREMYWADQGSRGDRRTGRYRGKVCNIGVEPDNSYVVETVCVHNCWAHSSVSAVLLCRARDGQPYADLSAYAVACIIKNYADEGGWGAESADFIAKRGVPTSEFWPQQSVRRSNDNPKTWENAALNRITVEFADIQPNDDRAMASCLIRDEPVVSDFSWWAHSVCACRLVSWKPLSIWIWNSWGAWSNNGMGILSGSKASADGMVGVSLVRAAPA
jgi:hypothetical protein